MDLNIFKRKRKLSKAQGIVEFALVLPLLLLLVFGIIEAGRLLFLYSAVMTSSREAARYGSAAGEITGYVPHYGDCDGIKDAAMRMGRFAGVSATDVSISYDHGPGSGGPFAICPLTADQQVGLGDRISVQVVTTWQPLLPLVNFRSIPISAITRRTIIKDVKIEGTPPSPVTPTISFVLGDQTVDEGVGEVRVKLQLTAATDRTVSVPFSLDGIASPGVDYTVSASPVVLLPGDTTAEIIVNVLEDDIDEDAETAALVMGTPTNAIKGTPFVHILTIEDNDEPPIVSFMLADQSQPESVDGLVVLQLSNPSSRDITVNFETTGTAQGGIDYSITASPITIPALDTTFPIVVDVIDDLIDEEDEFVVLTLVDVLNATIGVPDVHILAILDNDDPPFVFFTWETQSGEESVGTMTVEVQLSGESSKDITVPFLIGGTATQGVDYTIDSTPIYIPPGELTGSTVVTINEDTADDPEDDETIILTIHQPDNARKGSPSKHTISITANPSVPIVSFASSGQTSDDAATGKLSVTVKLSAASSDDVSVPFTVGGTATLDVDFSISGSPVVIPAGGATANIIVSLYDDAIDEVDETIEITLGTPTNAILGNPSKHTITIYDNDPEPTLFFETNGQTVDEDVGSVAIVAQLNVMSGKDVTVPYLITGFAEEGADKDYTITPSPVVILAGNTSVNIVVDVLDDDLIETDEEVVLTLDAPTNAIVGSPAQHTLTIKDNEPNCPAPTSLPFFGTDTNKDLLTWPLQSQNPLVPVNLIEVTIHWPIASEANVTAITFGDPIYSGDAPPPYLGVSTPSPIWSGAFDSRQMIFVFGANPKSVAGDFYQVIATFEGCDPVSGIIPSD